MVFSAKDPLQRVKQALDAVDGMTAFTGGFGQPVNPVDVNKLFEAQYYLREAIAALAEELASQRMTKNAADATEEIEDRG